MPDRSEDTLEEELGSLDDEPPDTASSSDDVDLDALEAELGMSDDESSGDVGLDEDPSDQYSDLLGDAPAESGGTSTAADAGADADAGTDADAGGGFLSGLFGGSESASEPDAAQTDPSSTTPTDATSSTTSTDAGSVLDDLDTGPSTDADTAATEESSTSGSLRDRLTGFFSLRAFLATVLVLTVLGGIGGAFVPVPLVGGPGGIAVGAFLVGVVSGESRYLEAAVAGALVGAVGAFAGGLSVAFAAGATTRLLAVGGVAGLVLALIGAYFGNDLRAGLVGGGEDWSDDEL